MTLRHIVGRRRRYRERQRELRARSSIAVAERACGVCGCTEFRACPGGCSWAAWDLCSSCIGAEWQDEPLEGGSG